MADKSKSKSESKSEFEYVPAFEKSAAIANKYGLPVEPFKHRSNEAYAADVLERANRKMRNEKKMGDRWTKHAWHKNKEHNIKHLQAYVEGDTGKSVKKCRSPLQCKVGGKRKSTKKSKKSTKKSKKSKKKTRKSRK